MFDTLTSLTDDCRFSHFACSVNYTAESDTKSVNLLGIKLDASNELGKQQGFLYLGLAIVVFAGGIYTLNKK